jgi:hypothetical protein
MTQQDKHELHRLSTMLKSIDQQLDSSSVLREALQKAGIALSLSFIGGLRAKVESDYEQLGNPLTDVQHAHLRSLGIEDME